MIHAEYSKVKHISAVQLAVEYYKRVYAQGGLILKQAEVELNKTVENALSPR